MERPFWKNSAYTGFLADPFVAGTPLAGGNFASSIDAVGVAFSRLLDTENNTSAQSFLRDLTPEERQSIKTTQEQLQETLTLTKALLTADKPEKVIPVVQRVVEKIRMLKEGQLLTIPAGWVGMKNTGTLLYIVFPEKDKGYSMVISNGGSGIQYHPSSAVDGKIRYRSCIKIPRIPLKRIADPAFWALNFLLFTKDPPSEYSRVEVIYDALLPWLAEVTIDHREVKVQDEATMSNALENAFKFLSKDTPQPAAPSSDAPASDLGSMLLSSLQQGQPGGEGTQDQQPQPPPPSADLGAALLASLQGATDSTAPKHPRMLIEAFRESNDDPFTEFRSPCTGGTSHFKSVWEGARYLLRLNGMQKTSLKTVSLCVRREFLVLAAGSLLKSLPPSHPLITAAKDRYDVPFSVPELTVLTGVLTRARADLVGASHIGEMKMADITARGVKIIGLYVGAEWCPPCKAFTPHLVRLYSTLRDKGLEIIFVSADRDQQQFANYHGSMPWPAVPFALASAIAKSLNVSGIPTLLLFDAADGKLLTSNGVRAILDHAESFPWDDRSVIRPKVTDDDTLLLRHGCEQLAHKALKEHTAGRLTDGGLHTIHGLTSLVLNAAHLSRLPDGVEPPPQPDGDIVVPTAHLKGDTWEVPKLAMKGTVTSDPLRGFSLFANKETKGFEGERMDLSTPSVTNLLDVPVTVSSADEALAAILKCDEVCKKLVSRAKESSTCSRIVLHLQIIAAIGDLFTTTIPVPHPRDGEVKGVWASGFSKGLEMQKECLEKLYKLALLYITVWQSVESPTRGFDSERFLVMMAIACVFDHVVRMIHGDADTLLLSVLLREDGGYRMCTKLCSDGRPFDKVATTLELTRPEFTRTLNGTIAYLKSLERTTSTAIFDFPMPVKIELRKYGATCIFLRKFMERCGYTLIPEDSPNPPCEMEALVNWLTQGNTDLAAQHPEFGYMRDMTVLFRFAATMETRETELLRRRKDIGYQMWRLSFDDSLGRRGGVAWMGSHHGIPGLHWDVAGVRGHDLDIADITVTGFGNREIQWGEGPVVRSPASVDRLLEKESSTEDDVLHANRLPLYGDTLTREESELLMSALTVRYLSIPLVVDFFATMDRHTYLFNSGMQALLRAVLFELGPWSPNDTPPEIPHVPLRQTEGQKKEASVAKIMDAKYKEYNESLLGTSCGCLLNELRYAANAVVDPLVSIAEASLRDLGTCSVYSVNANYLCFLLDLLLDIFGYVDYALNKAGWKLSAQQAQLLLRGQGTLRKLLRGPFSDLLNRWKGEAEKAEDMSAASVVHSFLALVAQCQPMTKGDAVSDLLSSLAYVRNWHGFGLGRQRTDILTEQGVDGMSPEQRLIRFLQAQGVDTNHLAKGALDKYISTSRRSRPLFLHIGREVIRVPTLVRTTETSEESSRSLRLPPCDVPEAKLFSLLQTHRRGIARFLERCKADERDTIFGNVIRTALRNPAFAYEGWEFGGDGGHRYVAKKAQLQFDVQGCEVLWRNDDLKPVPDSMTQFPDFETIFGREALHCGVVSRTAHRNWVHVVGTEYDLIEWTEPDPTNLGTGAPLPTSQGQDHDLAQQLHRQEQQASSPSPTGMLDVLGGGMGVPRHKRHKSDEPLLDISDITFEGTRYSRAIDPYSDDPHPHPSEDWIIKIVREVVNAIYPKEVEPMKWQFYLPEKVIPDGVAEVTLLGCDGVTDENLTWKEARVKKTPATLEVWMLLTHGRRMFRSLVFSTNSRTALHNLSPSPDKAFASPLLRHAAGDFKRKRVHGPSLVIRRLSRSLKGQEMYIPPMLLQGLVPSAFLEAFHMWLGEDDIIRGEPIDGSESQWFDFTVEIVIKNNCAILRRRGRGAGYVPISKGGDGKGELFRDVSMGGETTAVEVSAENMEKLKELGLGHTDAAYHLALQKCDNSVDAAVQWLFDEKNVEEIASATLSESDMPSASDFAGRAVGTTHDTPLKSRGDMGWLPLLLDEGFSPASATYALKLFGGDPDVARQWLLDDANAEKIMNIEVGMDVSAPLKMERHDEEGWPDTSLDLKLLSWSGDDECIKALSGVLGNIEDLSHVLAWGMPSDAEERGYKITVIELPRLRLKFQSQKDAKGVWRLYLLDQPGWFVCDANDRVAPLIEGLPEYLLITNPSSEFRVLVPNHDLVRPRIPGVAFPVRVVPLRTSLGWEEVMEQRFFSYPVHTSESFLVCPGLAPTLYLVLVHLLSRNYAHAFKLSDGVCTDMGMAPDEQWIFDQLKRSEDDLHPDAVACRLRLSLSVLYAPVKAKWEMHEQMDRYISVLPHVSAACTLTLGEEQDLLRRCSQGTALIKNRLAVMSSSGGEVEQKPPNTVIPGRPWMKLFQMSQQYIDSHCDRLQRIQYKPPLKKDEYSIDNESLAELLWSDKMLQDDEGGGSKGMGLAFLYHVMRGGVPMSLLGIDVSNTVAELLLRWAHLKYARWGKETVEEGEVEGRLSRHIVQLAYVLRLPLHHWPTLPSDDTSARQLRWGLELYKEEGRSSMVKVFLDILDQEFVSCIRGMHAAGGLKDHYQEGIDRAKKQPLSLTNKVAPSPPTKMRPAISDAAANHRILPALKSGKVDEQLLGTPLATIVEKYIGWQGYKSEDGQLYDSLPFDVTSHPAAEAPTAKEMLRRLEQDVKLYATRCRERRDPHLLGFTDIAEIAQGGGKQDVVATLSQMIGDLEKLQAADSAALSNLSKELLHSANRIPFPPAGKASEHTRRVRFALDRLKRQAATVDIPFLSALFISSKGEEDLVALNPYADNPKYIISAVAAVLLHTNRIAHINAAKAMADNLRTMVLKARQRGMVARQVSTSSGGSDDLPRCGTSGGGVGDSSMQELRLSQAATSLAELLTQHRWYAADTDRSFDPRFLLFEFIFNIRLRKRQVEMVRWFADNINSGNSRVQQMIMGQGKTQVVSPLLVLLLANGERLVTQVMPSALLQQTRAVLQSCFAAPILPKKVYSLQFDRSVEDASEGITLLHAKLQSAMHERGVVVAPPEAIKSLELKFVELLHSLEATDLAALRPNASQRHTKEVTRLRDRMLARSDMADELVKILQLWKGGVLLMDEVDVLLHPLRSELNFPIGNKHPIDLSGHRWDMPMYLVDVFFYHTRGKTCLEADTLWNAACERVGTNFKGLADQISDAIAAGYDRDALQRTPHLVLLDQVYYHEKLKPLLARWLTIWLFRHLTNSAVETLTPEWVISYITAKESLDAVTLRTEDVKLLNLAREWICALLPHVLSKIDRVGFGLLQESDMVLVDPNCPSSRLLTAVPFVGKDVPSRSSEFAHPDVVIGLTILAFRYEGMRRKDLREAVMQLKKEYARQYGPRDCRPASVLFARWLQLGAEQKQKLGEKAESVLPLPLFHVEDPKQFDKLFKMVKDIPELIFYYLEQHIFPATMNFQRLKVSACGHELGSDLLFDTRAGFSGTPSNLLPLDLGCCEYEPGSDGDVVHTLTNPSVTTAELKKSWSAKGLLQDIAKADPPFHALIDTGAYITNMDNQEVASYLLDHLPEWFEGVVYLDKLDRKMVMLRNGRAVALPQCGITEGRRFTFYDQIHTTGMDIKQSPTARAVLTIGKDMTFRDYAQGAYRMRGIGKGQSIRLFVISEVQSRIEADLGSHRTSRPEMDVPAWLLLNSMRMEALQAVKLGEQELQNIWRKHALRTLVQDVVVRGQTQRLLPSQRMHRFDTESGASKEEAECLRQSIRQFREVISHDVDGTLRTTLTKDGGADVLRDRISKLLDENKHFTRGPSDEQKIERVVASMRGAAAAHDDKQLGFQAEVVHEQEAEQEQEQEAEQEEQRESAFSRDDEQHNPWACTVLTSPLDTKAAQSKCTDGESPFYYLRAFQATESQPSIAFPPDLLLTDNFFRPRWLGLGERRLKTASVLLVWKATPEEETYVTLVSLAEAETLRWMVHTGQPSIKRAASIQLVTPGGTVIDSNGNTPGGAVPSALLQCVRFFNGEMYYSDEQLTLIETALATVPLSDRRAFFLEGVRLRRRQRGLYTDTPVAKLFTPQTEWHLIRVRGRVGYIKDLLTFQITERGMDLKEIFESYAIDGVATREQLHRMLRVVVPGFSSGDLHEVVQLLPADESGKVSYEKLLAGLELPDLVPVDKTKKDDGSKDEGSGVWQCSNCTFLNSTLATTCGICEYGWTGTRECPAGKWVCSPETGGCTYFNPNTLYYCEVCSRARPDLATVNF